MITIRHAVEKKKKKYSKGFRVRNLEEDIEGKIYKMSMFLYRGLLTQIYIDIHGWDKKKAILEAKKESQKR